MTVKNIAKQLIDSLPGNVSMDDVMHALYVHVKFRNGEQEIKNNKGIPHDEAKKRLRRWLK